MKKVTEKHYINKNHGMLFLSNDNENMGNDWIKITIEEYLLLMMIEDNEKRLLGYKTLVYIIKWKKKLNE